MLARIQEISNKIASEVIEWRRHLHAHPELSYQEFKTAAFVQEKLQAMGIPFEIMATTGVIGLIQGKNPESRIVALRADMDALPIQEENDLSFKSTHPGIMHACGHDVHTACLLGAAKILQETRTEWSGTVKLIFQPGEEKNPGGASLLIQEGVLENPKPQAIAALHVNTILEAGKVSFRSGKVMASADELYFTIKGKGGHAASPHLTVDPILISSHLITALQQLISRHNHPFNPTVLSITSIHGGNTTNVIPDEVKLMGTFRAMEESWRFEAHQKIRQLSESLVRSMGGELDLHIDVGYPCVHNDPQVNEACRLLAETYLGAENVSETELRMGAEDFGFYAQQIPGCFFRLGTRNELKGIVHGVHTPRFMVEESAIETGVGLMAWLGMRLLAD
ncbi:MAG: amidohydrolase [Bacteroidetes bacterium]|nr:amidohydrolase [Bacteroidota bacterium]